MTFYTRYWVEKEINSMSKKQKNNLLVHPITGEPKLCFPSGIFMMCNFTEKDGKVYRFSKTKDFIKFLNKTNKNSKNSEDLFKKKNELVSNQARLSN